MKINSRKLGTGLNFVQEIRRSTKLTQEEFSLRYKIPMGTLRGWEQEAHQIPKMGLLYLHLIKNNPELIANEVRKITARR